EEEARKKAGKIAGYLAKAQKELDANRFESAREFVEKTLDLEEDNSAAREMLARVAEAGDEYRAEQARIKKEKEARKKAELAMKEQAEWEKKQQRNDKKMQNYVSRSGEYLSKEDYSSARKYAYKARDVSLESGDVAALITRIDKEEIFGKREQARAAQEKKIQKTLKETEGEDPFHEYDEGKSWTDYIVDLFKRKTYELGDIQDERTYSIDECVQLALRRSQRMIMADQQVKLAEMRVWEVRRDLMPSVTARVETSSGKIHADNYHRHYRGRKYQVEVKQTVFDGFGTWFEGSQAQTNLKVVKLEREKVVNEVVEETKRAYYNLDKADKALELQKKNKELVDRFFGIMEEAHKDNYASRVDYLNVKGQKLQTDFQNISANEDVNLAEMILFQAMNMEPDRHIRIETVEKPKKLISIGLKNCYQLALANRPEFQIKKQMIEYYDFERKMMKAKGWPKISFDGSFGAMVEKFEPMFLPADWKTPQAGGVGTGGVSRAVRDWEAEWFTGAKVSWPLWGNTLEYNYVREHWAPTVSAFRGSESATSYFALKFLDDLEYFSNLQEARVGFERAKYEYLKAKKDLLVEIKELYFKYRKALLQMEVAEAKLEHQEVFMDVLRERLRYGELEIEKIVEEYDKFIEFEYGVLASDTDYYISLTELNKAVGISDYFKPEYETREYAAWQAKAAEEKAAVERAKGEAEDRKRAERIAGFLGKAGEQLDRNRFDRAREYGQKALQLDPENILIQNFLKNIEKTENEKRQADEAIKNVQ
ncbi:MAG: TolC family protein, partial [Candidatus Omnitrophota bacterium]|nr:TolC family protein [Candidatus Omnitrophota bacterium]